jgi:hypothetical protein
MNQGTQGYSLTKKTEGRKSRDTVSLRIAFPCSCGLDTGIRPGSGSWSSINTLSDFLNIIFHSTIYLYWILDPFRSNFNKTIFNTNVNFDLYTVGHNPDPEVWKSLIRTKILLNQLAASRTMAQFTMLIVHYRPYLLTRSLVLSELPLSLQNNRHGHGHDRQKK